MQLRLKHQRYIKEIESKKFDDFLEVELNVDALREYMIRKFPLLSNEGYDPQKIYHSLKDCNKLRDVNEIVDRTEKARNACIAELNMVPTRESTLLLSSVIWWLQKLRSAGLGVDDLKAQFNKQNAPFHPMLYSVIQKNLYLIEVQANSNVLNANV